MLSNVSTSEHPSLLIADHSERIILVDALRGFALLGILIAHITLWFDGGPLPMYIYQKYANDIPSGITFAVLEIFLRGKFFGIFSFLFGLSFALQMLSASKKNKPFVGRFLWRLFLLGLIGFLHHLHWRGDILTIYALLGIGLLLSRNLPDKALLIMAFLLLLNIPTRLTDMYFFISDIKRPDMFDTQQIDSYFKIITQGNYWAMLWANLYEFQTKMSFQIGSGRLYITLGFFLLGLYAGRKNLFGKFPSNVSFFQSVFKYCGWGVLGIFVIVLLIGFGSGAFQGKAVHWSVQIIGGLFYDLFNLTLAIFYIATFSLLFRRTRWQNTLTSFAPVGKIALTNYVLQTLIGLLLFYGIGFNLIGKWSPFICIWLSIPIFAFQIWFSRLWLQYFQYGLLEWLWRSATDLKWRSLRKNVR